MKLTHQLQKEKEVVVEKNNRHAQNENGCRMEEKKNSG
jgi:hypothetical protein